MTNRSADPRFLAQTDLQAGRITEAARLVVVELAQYQIDEFDIGQNEAAENIAQEMGVPFQVILELIAGRVRD